jgi:hypothetical protein
MGTWIYGLRDPETQQIRYIGQSINPKRRFKDHCTPKALSKKSHKNSWIKNLQQRNIRPELTLLQYVPTGNSWAEAEIFWISLYGNLTNLTIGGEGKQGHKHSEETRKQMSMSALGKKKSVETRAKMSAWKRQPRIISKVTRDKVHDIHFNKKKSTATSKYLGVSWNTERNKWVTKFNHDGRTLTIGRFSTEIEAARAYDTVIESYRGKETVFNFPEEQPNTGGQR